MGHVNIEDMHIHAVAVVLIPYPRRNLDMIVRQWLENTPGLESRDLFALMQQRR